MHARKVSAGQDGTLPGYRPLQGNTKPKKNIARNVLMVLAVCLIGYFFVRSSEITASLGISAPLRPGSGKASSTPGFTSHAADKLAGAAQQQQQQQQQQADADADDGSLVVDTPAAAAAAGTGTDANTDTHHAGGGSKTLGPAASLDQHVLDAKDAPKLVGNDLVDPKDEARRPAQAQAGSQDSTHHTAPQGVYTLSALDITGKEQPLSKYAGKVTLFVNVASRCGFTDANYKGLQQLYDKYKASGLEILAFPCNQFGAQEPGSNAEIQEFCTSQYHTTFPLFGKIDVNGPTTHAVYAYLKRELKLEKLTWNFNKILVNRAGQPVKHFPQQWDQAAVEQAVHTLLTEASV